MPVVIIVETAPSPLIDSNKCQTTALNKFEFWIYSLTSDSV